MCKSIGGFEFAGMAGAMIAGAHKGVVIVLGVFISMTASLEPILDLDMRLGEGTGSTLTMELASIAVNFREWQALMKLEFHENTSDWQGDLYIVFLTRFGPVAT